ncbi:hypothetical protein CC2G_000776 [Coprinopsis cinerea AmutBmut pab1-1]|nr:hypothetical protein CC2G_000776 [Coprinopsis cinerea AmutBmut pab1-1]
MSSTYNNMALPPGWIEQYDPQSGRNFYVDTRVSPPRVTWYHPFEDPEYLRQNPEARNQARDSTFAQPPGPMLGRRRSFGGTSSTPAVEPSMNNARAPHKQGFLEKLKDKALTSLEAREERRNQSPMVCVPVSGGEISNMTEGQMYGPQQRYYGPPTGGYAAPQAQYTPASGYGPAPIQYQQAPPASSSGRRRGFGGALPLLGGLAGGMLLEDAIDHHERDEFLQDEALYNSGFDGGGLFGGGGLGLF